MNILVTGGLGFIGSHMATMLVDAGHTVAVVDRAARHPLQAIPDALVVRGDLADSETLEALFEAQSFDAVMHFAGSIQVAESLRIPGAYYANNVGATLNLLDTMVRHDCLKLVFSSSAAVYGEPRHLPIDEDHPIAPLSPYGKSKAMVESILADFFVAHGLSSISLRYFNAAGASPDGRSGELHEPETHLIPLALQVASGRRRSLGIFGTDFDTPDGTAIRDYVHVIDLCTAHLAALDLLEQSPGAHRINLGNGSGFSVREILAAVRRVTQQDVMTESLPRRPGDPPRLVASNGRARRELHWWPRYADIDTIVAHAWAWELALCRHSAHHVPGVT